MELATLLEQNRETILGKWFDLIAGTYPEVTSEFLAKQKDQFRNPVGHAISRSIGPIFDQVVSAMDTDELLRRPRRHHPDQVGPGFHSLRGGRVRLSN